MNHLIVCLLTLSPYFSASFQGPPLLQSIFRLTEIYEKKTNQLFNKNESIYTYIITLQKKTLTIYSSVVVAPKRTTPFRWRVPRRRGACSITSLANLSLKYLFSRKFDPSESGKLSVDTDADTFGASSKSNSML